MSDKLESAWKEAAMALSRYSPHIYMEGLRKTMKTSSKITGALAEIQTEHLLNTSQKCYLC
jgi:hypothetical protein